MRHYRVIVSVMIMIGATIPIAVVAQEQAQEQVPAASGWTDAGVSGSYHVYTQGEATLNVATAINVSRAIQVDFSTVVNADVVRNGSDATEGSMDSGGGVFITQALADNNTATPIGIANDGLYDANSYHPEVQLLATNSNDGNNALRDTAVNSTNVDVVDDSYHYLHVFTVATNGSGQFQVTLNYADTTSTTSSAVTVEDWALTLASETASSYYLTSGMDVWRGDTSSFSDSNNRSIFGYRFAVDNSKTLASIDLATNAVGASGSVAYLGATLEALSTWASDPLVLDLDGNGIELTSLSSGTLFDLNGDTIPDAAGWIGSGDGLLVLDQDGDGQIETIREVVSEWSTPDATSSLDALATMDRDQNGQIDSADDVYHQLQVWADQNQDGISASEELYGLSDLGISSLGLTLDVSEATSINGNYVTGFATITYEDGQQGDMAEVQLAFDPASNVVATATHQGTAAADTLVGGDGTDILDGGLGQDVLQGGDGDDILFWDGADLLVDGGAGHDTLVLMETNKTLDLTAVSNDIIKNVEKIDLTGTGDNALSLDIEDLLDLSDGSNQLMIDGDRGDVVNLHNGLDWMLNKNGDTSVEDVNYVTNDTGQTTIGSESYMVYHDVNGLNTLLINSDMVLNVV